MPRCSSLPALLTADLIWLPTDVMWCTSRCVRTSTFRKKQSLFLCVSVFSVWPENNHWLLFRAGHCYKHFREDGLNYWVLLCWIWPRRKAVTIEAYFKPVSPEKMSFSDLFSFLGRKCLTRQLRYPPPFFNLRCHWCPLNELCVLDVDRLVQKFLSALRFLDIKKKMQIIRANCQVDNLSFCLTHVKASLGIMS